VLIELSPYGREASLSSHAKPVDMSFKALVERREMTQGIVWPLGRRVAQRPEERGFFGVLLDDVTNELGRHA
jgi:hypothetical protein